MKFYKCNTCGQVITVVKDTGVIPFCCGAAMEELKANTEEEKFGEKHIPVYSINEDKVVVKIGSIPHPMLREHFIEWILLVTSKGCQKINLQPGENPTAEFHIGKDEVVKEIYAYCNVHSLWKTTNETK